MEVARRRRAGDWAVWVAFAVVGVILAHLFLGARDAAADRDVQDSQIEALAAALAAEQEAARSRGEDPVAPPPDELTGDDPDTTPPVVIDVTDSQVYRAFATYVAINGPDGLLDPAQLRRYVGDWLAANPPADGKDAPPVTPEQLFATAEVYFALNPPPAGPAGPAGPQGEPGPGPTAEEYLNVLRSYLADNPDVLCPTGYTVVELHNVLTSDGLFDLAACARPS